eukprot:760368-Hanusia_phi.AAC.1
MASRPPAWHGPSREMAFINYEEYRTLTGTSVVSMQDTVISFGGVLSRTVKRPDCHECEPQTVHEAFLQGRGPSPRSNPSMSSTNDSIIIFGGVSTITGLTVLDIQCFDALHAGYSSELFLLDVPRTEWTAIFPPALIAPSMITISDMLYVFGGQFSYAISKE